MERKLKKILFYDSVAPRIYRPGTIDGSASGIGGAEATLVRIATRLATMFDVSVVQPGATASVVEDGIKWLSNKDGRKAIRSADVVIIQREAVDAYKIRWLNRRARIILWYHDWYRTTHASRIAHLRYGWFKPTIRALAHFLTSASFVAVSDTHLANIHASMGQSSLAKMLMKHVQGRRIYNPLSEAFTGVPRRDDFDRDKLVYISAPWKGLEQVIDNFRKVKAHIPTLRLHVASPSYDVERFGGAEDVIWEGSLSHEALIPMVQTALCVFYPAAVAPETFGLVFAESHAVGTPVLAHPFGAACELLSDAELVEAGDADAIRARIVGWRDGTRPDVGPDAAFLLDNIVQQWAALLE
ncbi:MAG: glycosyltransferase family 4 protein [Sphingobium sp.]